MNHVGNKRKHKQKTVLDSKEPIKLDVGHTFVARWRTLFLPSIGRGFNSRQPRFRMQLWASCSYMCLLYQAV